MAVTSSLEAALEELYGTPPADFTKARASIAKRLKIAGDTEAAKAVAEQRKPTRIAWILNQLARRFPDDVAELVDVGRELLREQRKALRGDASTSLRGSIERQRKVVAALTQTAGTVMKDLGVAPGGHLEEVASALRAALVDPVIGARLEEGRFDKAPEAAAGFAGTELLGGVPASEMPRPTARRPKRPKTRARADEKARDRARKKALDEALAAVRAAEVDAKHDSAAADKARLQAERAAIEAEAKRKRAEELTRAAQKSEASVATARKALARLE